jgi:hypothetical protein
MSTLGEHTGNENPTEAHLQQEGTKAQLHDLPRHFDVLPSRFDRFIFKYIYIYMISLFFLTAFLFVLISILLGQNTLYQIGPFLHASGVSASVIVGMIFVIWPFYIWQASIPKTLRDIFEKKRVYIPGSDVSRSYLRFLAHYHGALANWKRYLPCGLVIIVVGSLYAYSIVQFYRLFFSTARPDIVIAALVVIQNLLYPLAVLGGVYCIGIQWWTMYISGWYVRTLVRTCTLRVQPRHPDKCGGLKVLGNFCFGSVFPIFVGTGLAIGLIVFSLQQGGNAVFLALNVGVPSLSLLLYVFPAAIFALFLPLRDIHAKMVSEREADEDAYIARIETLEEQIQNLLDSNHIEEAKAMHEKKALLETLHAPYPTWPFRFRSKFFSAVLGVSGSLLIGLITAAAEQYILPAIVALLFHKP